MAPGGTYSFSPKTGQPYLYWNEPKAPKAVSIQLDDVFLTPQLAETVSWGSKELFTLEPGSPVLPYSITASGDIWSFDGSPLRKGVTEAFDAMLAALDDPAGQPPMRLKGGRSWLIRHYLAQALPQTFAESLYFRYGLDSAGRTVDLVPGMRLRIDHQSHQAIDPEASLLNGFVGSASVYIDVTQRPSPLGDTLVTAFDPFLAELQQMTVQSSSGGAGGAIDLQGSANAFPYWRLAYPQQYFSSDSTGVVGSAGNPVLIGAPTLGELATATSTYTTGGTVVPPAAAIYFRGRTAIVPEIPVLLQGTLRHVALGSTVRDLLSGQFPVPWLPGARVQGQPSQFLLRPLTLLYEEGNPAQPQWNYSPVQVPVITSYTAWGDQLDTFDLPLTGGDILATFTLGR